MDAVEAGMPHTLDHQICRAREHVTPIAGELDSGGKQGRSRLTIGGRTCPAIKLRGLRSSDTISVLFLMWFPRPKRSAPKKRVICCPPQRNSNLVVIIFGEANTGFLKNLGEFGCYPNSGCRVGDATRLRDATNTRLSFFSAVRFARWTQLQASNLLVSARRARRHSHR